MYRVLSERAEARLDELSCAGEIARLEGCIDRLKSQLKLAVVFAGDKSAPGSVLYPSRNTRSWKSYEVVAGDIAAALRRVGFRHVHLMPDDMNLSDRLRRAGIHMAWLNTGGVQGYNPAAHASAMLEMLGVPYVGHDPLTASTLDNKHAFKREALCAGLPTAPFTTWHMARGPFRPELNSRFQLAFGDYAGPFVVKPVSGRASLHVHVVDDRAALPDVVAEIYRETENLVLIEKYLRRTRVLHRRGRAGDGAQAAARARPRALHVCGGRTPALVGRADLHLDGRAADHQRSMRRPRRRAGRKRA